jgi:hypothetical protein
MKGMNKGDVLIIVAILLGLIIAAVLVGLVASPGFRFF